MPWVELLSRDACADQHAIEQQHQLRIKCGSLALIVIVTSQLASAVSSYCTWHRYEVLHYTISD